MVATIVIHICQNNRNRTSRICFSRFVASAFSTLTNENKNTSKICWIKKIYVPSTLLFSPILWMPLKRCCAVTNLDFTPNSTLSGLNIKHFQCFGALAVRLLLRTLVVNRISKRLWKHFTKLVLFKIKGVYLWNAADSTMRSGSANIVCFFDNHIHDSSKRTTLCDIFNKVWTPLRWWVYLNQWT